MKKTVGFIVILFAFLACSPKSDEVAVVSHKQPETLEEIKSSIKEIDDSLKGLFDQAMNDGNFNIDNAVYFEAINRNKLLFLKYPEDAETEKAIEKIGSIYLQLNQEHEAVKWRDTLLLHYPNTLNKAGILELQMNYYDLNEYNPAKIQYYAQQILALEGLSEEKREQIEFRLENIDKTFEELVLLQFEE